MLLQKGGDKRVEQQQRRTRPPGSRSSKAWMAMHSGFFVSTEVGKVNDTIPASYCTCITITITMCNGAPAANTKPVCNSLQRNPARRRPLVCCCCVLCRENYPFDPPRVKFTTPIYHPNVSNEGGICLSILFKSCSWDNGWSPALSITSVLISIMVLMGEPATGECSTYVSMRGFCCKCLCLHVFADVYVWLGVGECHRACHWWRPANMHSSATSAASVVLTRQSLPRSHPLHSSTLSAHLAVHSAAAQHTVQHLALL